MAKTIEDYKRDYEAARASGDAAAMKAANDGANAIRTASGQAAQSAGADIAAVAARGKGGSSGYTAKGTYNDGGLSASDRAKVDALKAQWEAAYKAGDTEGMNTAHDGAQAIRAEYGYSGGSDGSQYIGLDTDEPVKQTGGVSPSLTSASGQYDRLNDYYAAYQDAALQALKSAYDENMLSLDAQAAKIPAVYQDAANRTAANYETGRKNLNEQLAASGLNTGAGGQAALALFNQNQADLSGIEKARAEALNDVETTRTATRIEYQNAVAQAIRDGNLQKAQALYDEAVRVDESIVATALNQAQLDYQYWTANNQLESDYQTKKQQYSGENRALAQEQVNAILQAGGTPPAELVAASGYSQEYIDALRAYYMGQSTFSGGTYSGGTYRESAAPESDSGESRDTETENEAPAAAAGGRTAVAKITGEMTPAEAMSSVYEARKNGATNQEILDSITGDLMAGVISNDTWQRLRTMYKL